MQAMILEPMMLQSMVYLLQQGPADTVDYMIAGYAVIFGVMLLYLVSLIVRQRNLKQDMELLQDLEDKSLETNQKVETVV